MKKLNPLLKNAALISVGGLIVKLLGAFYRIPLNNILKADGLEFIRRHSRSTSYL